MRGDDDGGYDHFEDDVYDDDDDDDVEAGAQPATEVLSLGELIDNSAALTWWDDPASRGPIDLRLGDEEVCAVTPSVDLTPYSSQYEGYMGNYGNTSDRWYRRAALVIWPAEQGFAARTEASPGWALRTILGSLSDGEQERAREETRILLRVWGGSPQETLLSPALDVASGIQDPELAEGLLAPFAVEMLDEEDAVALGALARHYLTSWWTSLSGRWGSGRGYGHTDRGPWLEFTLVPLCRALAAMLTVADERHGADLGEQVCSFGDEGLPLLVAAVRAHEAPMNGAMVFVAGHARDRLVEVLARPARTADDLSIAWTSPGGEDADRLGAFLASAAERALEWPLAERRRRSIHHLITTADLPVSHVTRRSGRPYTLLLTKKTADLFAREAAARTRAEEDLRYLRSVLDRE